MNKPETPTAAPVAPPETVTRWLVLLRASDGRAELLPVVHKTAEDAEGQGRYWQANYTGAPVTSETVSILNQSWKVHSVQMHSGQDTNCTEQPEQPERTECPELPENSEAVSHNGEQTAARHCGEIRRGKCFQRADYARPRHSQR